MINKFRFSFLSPSPSIWLKVSISFIISLSLAYTLKIKKLSYFLIFFMFSWPIAGIIYRMFFILASFILEGSGPLMACD